MLLKIKLEYTTNGKVNKIGQKAQTVIYYIYNIGYINSMLCTALN